MRKRATFCGVIQTASSEKTSAHCDQLGHGIDARTTMARAVARKKTPQRSKGNGRESRKARRPARPITETKNPRKRREREKKQAKPPVVALRTGGGGTRSTPKTPSSEPSSPPTNRPARPRPTPNPRHLAVSRTWRPEAGAGTKARRTSEPRRAPRFLRRDGIDRRGKSTSGGRAGADEQSRREREEEEALVPCGYDGRRGGRGSGGAKQSGAGWIGWRGWLYFASSGTTPRLASPVAQATKERRMTGARGR